MNDQSLADFGNRVPRPPRRSLTRDGLSWVLVALVHVFLIGIFVMSEILPSDDTHQSRPIETIFLLSMLPNTNAPEIHTIRPEVPSAIAPVITTAPVVVVPPEPPMIEPETPADILRAIAEALACGANSFETLSPAQQLRCRHEPWIPKKLPNGEIVLDAPPKPEQGPIVHMSGAEALRHDLQVAPDCPILQQAPCLHDAIGNMRGP